jgi:preprotein translocase subunit SecE
MATRTTGSRKTAAKNTERQNSSSRLSTLIHDTRSEIRKVTWPDRETTRNLTIVVIVMAVILGVLLGGIDAIFIRVWDAIPSL